MRVAGVAAQAKINLWLTVGPRDDATGYHDIDTLFHRIDLADQVTVRVGGNVRTLDVSGPRVPDGGLGAAERNLAYRAAVAYAEHAPWLRGFSIELTKNIPVGGGLGGGSADAGAVLRALNALARTPLDAATLMTIAAWLGADVAFLASELVAAHGTGRGERLLPATSLPVRDLMIVVPDFAIGTADAYRWLDEARAAEGRAKRPQRSQVSAPLDWDDVARSSHNDFEPVVERAHPELGVWRERLRAGGARVARLAGSGSSVFGVFEGAVSDAVRAGLGAPTIATRSSARVVPVEVAE